MSFNSTKEDDKEGFRRSAVQHLALFVPWEDFVSERSGDINAIWQAHRDALPRRIRFYVNNVQLLRRSAEDAKRDVKQWAAASSSDDPIGGLYGELEEAQAGEASLQPSDYVQDAISLIDVLEGIMEEIGYFLQETLSSPEGLEAGKVLEPRARTIQSPGHFSDSSAIPEQKELRGIKSQQMSTSKEREKII